MHVAKIDRLRTFGKYGTYGGPEVAQIVIFGKTYVPPPLDRQNSAAESLVWDSPQSELNNEVYAMVTTGN